MASNSSTTVEIIVCRVPALRPTSAGAVIEEKHEFILQDEKCACKSTLIVGTTIETAKSCIKVAPAADDGGRVVVKVESSYKLLPVPDVEAQVQDEIAETHEKIITETHEMGAANFKVKLE